MYQCYHIYMYMCMCNELHIIKVYLILMQTVSAYVVPTDEGVYMHMLCTQMQHV